MALHGTDGAGNHKESSMKMSMVPCALALLMAVVASSCSSADDEMYQHFRCAKAATLLERETEAQNAMVRSYKAAKTLGEPNARYFMMLGQRFQDDVPLYKYTAGGQVQLLTSVYKERRCQKMYAPMTREEETEMARVLGLEAPGDANARSAVIGEPMAPPPAPAPPEPEAPVAAAPAAEEAAVGTEPDMAQAAAQAAYFASQPAGDVPVRAVAEAPPTGNAFTPSFDCARASAEVEHLICGDASLSVMDARMAGAYRKALPCGGEGLRAEQREWIRYKRNACRDGECLADAYAVRTAELGDRCH